MPVSGNVEIDFLLKSDMKNVTLKNIVDKSFKKPQLIQHKL